MSNENENGAVATDEPKVKKAKKAAKPKAKAKKSKAKKEKATKGGLSGNQVKILQALKATAVGGRTMTRGQIKKATGINGGLYRLMGAPSKDGFGQAVEGALEPAGLVKSISVEGTRGFGYAITAKGKAALEKA